MDRKVISVSQKRQITIPLKFFKQAKLGNEVECYFENGAVVIRSLPVGSGEFSVEILKDLVAQGLSGDDLVTRFEEMAGGLKRAAGRALEEADEIASGKRKAASMSDVFGKE